MIFDLMRVRTALRLLVLLGTLLPGAAAIAAENERLFDIEAQDVASALMEFGRQAGIEVMFPFSAVQGIRSNAVKGRFTTAEALNLLLTGTGLVARPGPESVIAITPGAPSGDPGKPAPQAPPVSAPSTPSPDAAPAARLQELEEIVVTARKREENLLRVPQSITAVGASTIGALDLDSVYDLQSVTPNFLMEKTAGRRTDRPVIRGQANVAGDTNASFFVDGVYVSGSISSTSLDALERVEVLRGPQAALFGRASFSGAVNYVTKAPADLFEGAMNVRAGSQDDYKISTWARGPIIPGKLQFFAGAGWNSYGGRYYNHNPGTPPDPLFIDAPTRADYSRLGSEKNWDVVGKLRWLLSDDAQINVKLSYLSAEDSHMAAVAMTADDLNCYLPVAGTGTANSRGYYCGEARVGDRVTRVNIPDFEDGITSRFGTAAPADVGGWRKVWRNAADVSVGVGGWTLFAQAAYDRDEAQFATDFDLSLSRALFGSLQSLSFDDRSSRSLELRATSRADARLRGFFGLFAHSNETVFSSRTFAASPITLTEATRKEVENIAAFGQLQYGVTDALTLTVEGRYAEDERSLPGAASRPAEATFYSFTPRFTADYVFSDSLMLYALAARGNKPGDFNSLAYSRVQVSDADFALLQAEGLDRVDEEEQWTYELGAKGHLLDGRVGGSLGFFYIDWTNQSLYRTLDVTNGAGLPGRLPLLVNAGKTSIWGTELELNLRAGDHMTLALGYGYARSRLDRYNDDEIAITTGYDDPLLLNGGNARGKRLPFAPEHTANLSASWRAPLADGLKWYLSTNARYESRKYDSVTNYLYIGDVLLWNWRVGMDGEKWGVGLYFNNVLDDRTPTGVTRSSDYSAPRFVGGTPRAFQLGLRRGFEYGLTAQYRF